jgi:hypothetical protein
MITRSEVVTFLNVLREDGTHVEELQDAPCGAAVASVGGGRRWLFLPERVIGDTGEVTEGFSSDLWPVTNCGHNRPGCRKVGCPAVEDQEWAAAQVVGDK